MVRFLNYLSSNTVGNTALKSKLSINNESLLIKALYCLDIFYICIPKMWVFIILNNKYNKKFICQQFHN